MKSPLTPLGTARVRAGLIGQPTDRREPRARTRASGNDRPARDPGFRFPEDLRPQLAAQELDEAHLYLAWELAREARLPADDERALVLLVLASLASSRQGATRLQLSGEEARLHLAELYGALGGTPAERERACALFAELRGARLAGRAAALDPIAGLPGERRPLILDGHALYHERLHAHEVALARALGWRLHGQAPDVAVLPGSAEAIADVLARPPRAGAQPMALTVEQRRALGLALVRPLTVITGGPGTGKTSIVAALLRVLSRLGVAMTEVQLAAPTGKAAFRLRESIARTLPTILEPAAADRALVPPAAQTLHRLLGWSPGRGRFLHHHDNRLAARVVIVDEASMIDLPLMAHLCDALDETTRLVLLGDADQLPSVEAGAVLRDLLPGPGAVAPGDDPRAAWTAALTESWRMSPSDPAGRRVLEVAQLVRRGEADALLEGAAIIPLVAPQQLAWQGVERISTVDRSAFLDLWFQTRVLGLAGWPQLSHHVYELGEEGFLPEERESLDRLFAHAERARLLTVTRGEQPAGAARLNARLHERMLAFARATGELHGAPQFHPGEPLMVLHNDYARGLWNGDQGLCLRVRRRQAGPTLMAVFARDQALTAFPIDALRGTLQHAYATTVHKSQGSELDHVALFLPDEDLPLCTRELVYTAITRARTSATLVGDPALLAAAVRRSVRRSSGLGYRLRHPTR